MGKIRCECGYTHDLVNCPYRTGWKAIRDDKFDAVIEASITQAQLSAATPGTPKFDQLIRADEDAFGPVTEIFECPDCQRLIWHRSDDEPVYIFSLEKKVP